ncbi:MAG: sialidase family protein [Promethearchaeota archaeon]
MQNQTKTIMMVLIMGTIITAFSIAGHMFFSPYFEYKKLKEVEGTKILISKGDLNGDYNAFPKAIKINHPNSEYNGVILAVWYSGNAHVDKNSDGRIYRSFSHDNGQNWSDPFEIYDDPTLDCRNIGIVNALNGTIILFFAKMDAFEYRKSSKTAWKDFGFIKSYDGGNTWSEYISIINQSDFQSHNITNGNGYGDPVFVNGSIYISCYGTTSPNSSASNLTHMAYILKSDDNGESWSLHSTFSEDSIKCSISTSEADFLYNQSNNLLFGFSRTQNLRRRYLYYFESSDLGLSFDKFMATNILGDCPDIFRLSDGRYIVAIRAFAKTYPYLGYFVLPADFATNSNRYAICQNLKIKCMAKPKYGTKSSDIAYPSIVGLDNGTILVVYYDINGGGIFGKIIEEKNL